MQLLKICELSLYDTLLHVRRCCCIAEVQNIEQRHNFLLILYCCYFSTYIYLLTYIRSKLFLVRLTSISRVIFVDYILHMTEIYLVYSVHHHVVAMDFSHHPKTLYDSNHNMSMIVLLCY